MNIIIYQFTKDILNIIKVFDETNILLKLFYNIQVMNNNRKFINIFCVLKSNYVSNA